MLLLWLWLWWIGSSGRRLLSLLLYLCTKGHDFRLQPINFLFQALDICPNPVLIAEWHCTSFCTVVRASTVAAQTITASSTGRSRIAASLLGRMRQRSPLRHGATRARSLSEPRVDGTKVRQTMRWWQRRSVMG
jgi:hypothetical protein